MTLGSLFAGIGAFELGFERAGFQCLWQIEIDPACRSVLERHWPKVIRYDDIRTFKPKKSMKVDVICGGWPCQDHSVAGKREGFDGDRSVLFWEMIRVVKRLRPRFLLWENVPGLASSDDGRDFTRVLRGLADIGYFGAIRRLDAQWFGVPQQRKRYFGLFARCDIGTEWRSACEILAIPQSLRRHPAESKKKKQRVATTLTAGTSSGRGVSKPGRRREDDINLVPTLQSSDGGASSGYHPVIPTLARCKTTREGLHQDPTIETMIPICFGSKQITSKTNRTKAEPGNVCNTLHQNGMAIAFNPQAGGKQTSLGVGDQLGSLNTSQVPALINNIGVRRLTPKECERAQGLPDDHTRYAADGTENSDSRRYAMIGNSVVPNVVEWIGRRIMQCQLK